jgi:hypothetical protein
MPFSSSQRSTIRNCVILLLFAAARAGPTFQPPLLDLERRLIVKTRPGSIKEVKVTGVTARDELALRAAPAARTAPPAAADGSLLHSRLEPGASMEQALLELNARDGNCRLGCPARLR